MKIPSRFQRDGIRLAKGLPAFSGAVGDQGLPRFVGNDGHSLNWNHTFGIVELFTQHIAIFCSIGLGKQFYTEITV